MSIEERLRTILVTDTAITALVGDRVRPDELAQEDTFPAILIEVDTEDPLNTLSDIGGLQKAKVKITALAVTKSAARSLAKLVRNCLDSTSGFVVDGVEIDITFENRQSGFAAADNGEDTGVYYSENEFEVWWDETTEED